MRARSEGGGAREAFSEAFSRSSAAMREACVRWVSCSALICAPKPMGMASVVVAGAGVGGVGPDMAQGEVL